MAADAGGEIRLVRVEMMRIASWEFDSGQSAPTKGEVVGDFLVEQYVGEQGSVADPGFAGMGVRSAVVAVNYRQIKLYANAFVDVVPNEELGRETADVFGIGVGCVASARLEGVEIGELLCEPSEESLTAAPLGLGRRINGTQITRQRRLCASRQHPCNQRIHWQGCLPSKVFCKASEMGKMRA